MMTTDQEIRLIKDTLEDMKNAFIDTNKPGAMRLDAATAVLTKKIGLATKT